MKRYLSGVAVAVLLAGASLSLSGQSDAMRNIMREKLEYSQKLLQGIVLADLPAIEENAEQLRLLSELSSWGAANTPEYQQASQEFRRIAIAIRDSARRGKVDAAAMGYVDLSLSCFQCHRYLRKLPDASRAGLPGERVSLLPASSRSSSQ